MKKIFLFLSFSGLLLAQQRDTVFLNLASGITTTPATKYLVTNNIGQTFHTFVVQEYQVTTGTCSGNLLPFGVAGHIEVSYNGTVYTQNNSVSISFTDDSFNNTGAKFYRVSGAYPFIRFVFDNVHTPLATGCALRLDYSGSLNSNPLDDANRQNILVHKTSVGNSCTQDQITTSQPVSSSLEIGLAGLSYFTMTYGTFSTLTVEFTPIGTGTDCSGAGSNPIFNWTLQNEPLQIPPDPSFSLLPGVNSPGGFLLPPVINTVDLAASGYLYLYLKLLN